jgi:hypothetical protein
MPSGKYLMEDFYYAGGLPAVIRELGDLIHKDALTVNGKTMGENVADAPCYNRDVIRTLSDPLTPAGGLAVLRGNLCPDGAIIKPSAASPGLMTHRGRAVGMILPMEPAEDTSTASEDATTAWDAFMRAGRRLERRFRPGVSGVRLLSAMRR